MRKFSVKNNRLIPINFTFKIIMKKIFVISSFVIGFSYSNLVFSQASNFEGLTAGINISSVGGSTKI